MASTQTIRTARRRRAAEPDSRSRSSGARSRRGRGRADLQADAGGLGRLRCSAILLVLAVAGELTAIEIDRPRLRISSGFTAIIVAAVFLGATPAALIGVLTVLADWAYNRFAARRTC